jgi:hypothetical protein
MMRRIPDIQLDPSFVKAIADTPPRIAEPAAPEKAFIVLLKLFLIYVDYFNLM